ncbi:MAG TPA: flavin reductase family protein [Bradyrhizobium sp.]|nr:flavin reductase family protein [Bradyrhizobium sp.]
MNIETTPDLFKAGMRKLLSGLSLITTQLDGKPYGLVATSVSSLATEPPSLIVCINKNASAHDPVLRSGAFAVNILNDQQGDLAARFFSSSRREERFVAGEWTPGIDGVPLYTDSLVCIECELRDAIPKYSHSIIIADVRRMHLNKRSEARPLSYFDGKCA